MTCNNNCILSPFVQRVASSKEVFQAQKQPHAMCFFTLQVSFTVSPTALFADILLLVGKHEQAPHVMKQKIVFIYIYSPLHPCFCGNRWVLFSIY